MSPSILLAGSLAKEALSPVPFDGPESVPVQPKFRHSFHVHQLTPAYWLHRAAQIEPDALAVHHHTANGKTLRRSYQATADRARGLAYYLKQRGHQRVGILCPNTPAFLEAIYGIGAAGAVNVAINYRFKQDDVEYVFDHSDVDLIIVDQDYEHLLDGFHERHPHVPYIIDTDSDQDTGPYDLAVLEGLRHDASTGARGWSGLEMETPSEEGLIALAYTSGTTARPKGVEYTHRGAYLAAMANIVESRLNTSLSSADRCHYLWTLPMFHTMGWTFPWAVTAVRGTHYMLRKIDYPHIWSLLKTEAISHYCAAPTVNTMLCADPNAEKLPVENEIIRGKRKLARGADQIIERVRVTVAASPPTAQLFEMMENLNLHPVHVYGLTETYGPITTCYQLPTWRNLPEKEKFGKLARQGHGFLTSLPARVVKTDQRPKDATPSSYSTITSDSPSDEETLTDISRTGTEIGEIVLRGNICSRGYYKDAAATRALYRGGWLHTGDLAVWHADGAIQIVDRAKDVIISGGENISSVALEAVLATHPAILEAACVAVPDKIWGEVPKAFVTLRPLPRTRLETLPTGEEIIEWMRCQTSVSGFMVPKYIEILAEDGDDGASGGVGLPKTSTGKVRKNVLRRWALEGNENPAEDRVNG